MKTVKQATTTDTQLEALYLQYMGSKGADGEEVAREYQKLYRHMEEFSWQKRNSVECAVNELCAVIERIAFLDGVRIGAKVALELTK